MNTFDEELERSIIQTILFYEDLVPIALIQLRTEDFFNIACAQQFEIIKNLSDKNVKIDIVSVTEKMRDMGLNTALISSNNNIPDNPRTLKESMSRLRNMSYLRGYKSIANKMSEMAEDAVDLDCAIKTAEEMLFEAIGRKEITDYTTLSKSIIPTLEQIDDRMRGKVGLKTGIKSLDDILIGLPGGCLVVLSARPSMGKSALAVDIMLRMAQSGTPGGLFSFEMRATSITERLIADKADVSYYNIRAGLVNENEMSSIVNSVDELSKAVICIDDSGAMNVDDLCQKIKIMKRRNKIGVVVIDHLSYISAKKKENRNQEIEYILKKLKSIGKELNIPIILLSQLSREVEKRSDKRPLLSDLRDSGSIEQDADIIMMLYRDDYYNKDSERKNLLDVFIRKNRDGMTGSTELLFNRNRMRFTDIPRHSEYL
jgi:replicative DNA helicase